MTEYTLPDLPYDHSALEPHYEARALELHRGTHHAGYVEAANDIASTLDLIGRARRTRSSVASGASYRA